MPSRALAALCAFVAAAAVVLQTVATVSSFAEEGKTAAAALWRLVGFFTIWGNLGVAVVAGAMAVAPASRLAAPRVRFAMVPAIVVVGVVFAVLLRYLLTESHGLQRFASHLLHDVVPPLFVLTWLASRHGALRWRDALWAVVFPALYLAFALLRTATQGFAPYWFLDWQTLGPLLYARNAAGLAVAFWVVGLIVVAADRLHARLAGGPATR